MRDYYTYDLEVYPNIFTFCGKFRNSNDIHMFEISDRMNQRDDLLSFLNYLRNIQVEMVGYNNIHYDYFLLHELITNPYTFDHNKAFQISSNIIRSNTIKPIKHSHRLIPQIDMVKVCHFDNKAKRTSLKALQCVMRSESVEDLPFAIRALNDQEKDKLKKYNIHDVLETEKFFLKNENLIDMRREYLDDRTLYGDVLNYSDVKIGTEYLISRIGRTNCFKGGKPNQTIRTEIDFNKIILPKIFYRTSLYQEIHSWFLSQKIYVASSERPKLEATLMNVDFHFGVGGIHASVENKIFETNDTHQIIDIDVAGMYVAVAIANRFAPEHLGNAYVEAYKHVKEDRKRYAKGTSKNAALKLAGNGAYGNSNNPFSPFYDPKYTFSVTINGQLQILQLVEMIDLIPDCELIQANTDGITIYINKKYEYLFKLWCRVWEEMTCLELEEVRYKRMWIRDVNNYISEKMDSELKRKGAYWYPLNEKDHQGWYNKDFSNLASKIAAEKVMTHSWSIEIAIKLVTNPFDFMLKYKTPRGAKVYIGDKEQLKTVRYYISTQGEPMKKIAKPKGEMGQFKRKNKITDKYFNDIMKQIGKDKWDERIHNKKKSKYVMSETSIQSGWLVRQCNKASDFNWNDLDWNYYIEEAKKIIIGSN